MCALAKEVSLVPRLLCSILRLVVICYKYGISPCLPVSCRFYPTCSDYALAALSRYGLIRGLAKILGRLLRCHPWSAGGYDPVLPTEREK